MNKKVIIPVALVIIALSVFIARRGNPHEAGKESVDDTIANTSIEESSENPLDVYLESVEDMLNTNFEGRYSLEHSDDSIVINIWQDGLADDVASVVNSGMETPEGWATIVSSFQALSGQIQSDLNNNGYGNVVVQTNIVSDKDHSTPMCSISGDSIVYDCLNSREDADSNDGKTELQETLKSALTSGVALFHRNVTDDVTGRWRLLVYSSGENIVNHAADYYRAYFENDNEVHMVVNLGLRTTAVINASGDSLYVDVHEYVDKEEHSAKTLGGGMLLKSYIVTISTGEIEEVS